MCKAMEDYITKEKIKAVRKMIAGGKLTLEEIAEYSDLPIEKIRELAESKTA